jgi:FMN phosphatase YigB (HAD superfamily)
LVATNGPSIATKEKLEKIDCLPFVKEVLSADMFGYMKPKIEFFEGIQETYQLPKESYLIIGDSLKSDVGFGMNCGIDSCWFDRGNETLTEPYQPTMIIKELVELEERL